MGVNGALRGVIGDIDGVEGDVIGVVMGDVKSEAPRLGQGPRRIGVKKGGKAVDGWSAKQPSVHEDSDRPRFDANDDEDDDDDNQVAEAK